MDCIEQLDDIVKQFNELIDVSCANEFLRYIAAQELSRLKWKELYDQCKHSKEELQIMNTKLETARKWLNLETKRRKDLEKENEILVDQLSRCTCTLVNFRKSIRSSHYRTADDELSSTTSHRTEDDLDESYVKCHQFKKLTRISVHLPATIVNSTPCKSDRKDPLLPTSSSQSDNFSATEMEIFSSSENKEEERNETVPTITKNNAHKSTDELKLSRSNYISLNTTYMTSKNHKFVRKEMSQLKECMQCTRDIQVDVCAFECMNCHSFIHTECYQNVTSVCTPDEKEKTELRSISDFAPLVPPMIPSPVVQFVHEIEKRGLKEIGVYKMPGIEEEINALREKFPNWKCPSDLSQYGVHTLCNYLKEYLNHVHPLIPNANVDDFHDAISSKLNKTDKLYLALSKLPQSHRDTLAFLMIHLRKVLSSKDCKMRISSISSVFGPLIFGLSNNENKGNTTLCELKATELMEEMLRLPSGYWHSFIVEPKITEIPDKLRSTPSTEEIIRQTAHKYFSTPKRKKRFFQSP